MAVNPTQLRACEEYCRRQGYEILERFHEEGESAKTTDRSQLQALLKYCRTHKGKVHFVIVYNLTRSVQRALCRRDRRTWRHQSIRKAGSRERSTIISRFERT